MSNEGLGSENNGKEGRKEERQVGMCGRKEKK